MTAADHPVLATRFETLLCTSPAQHVLQVTLNRPDVGNAMNTQMGTELLQLWTMIGEDAGELRCVVLTGAGDRIFCAGADLKERKGMSAQSWRRQHEIFERESDRLIDLPIPVIAAVNGHAYGGGLEMLLACDFAYGSREARFALTEVTLGIMPGTGGTQNLPRAVGERRAKEVILTGLPFDADQALSWGVLNAVFPAREVLAATVQTASRIAGNAPQAVRQAKRSIHHGLQMDLSTALRFEVEAYNQLIETEDRLEGVAAFNEKRSPRFTGR